MRPARINRTSEARRDLVKAARLHIKCARHGTASLARALDVSVATLMRVLDELRAQLASRNAELVSVRDRAGWRYEIRTDARSAVERWGHSPLRRLAGAPGRRAARLKPEDEEIYELRKMKDQR